MVAGVRRARCTRTPRGIVIDLINYSRLVRARARAHERVATTVTAAAAAASAAQKQCRSLKLAEKHLPAHSPPPDETKINKPPNERSPRLRGENISRNANATLSMRVSLIALSASTPRWFQRMNRRQSRKAARTVSSGGGILTYAALNTSLNRFLNTTKIMIDASSSANCSDVNSYAKSNRRRLQSCRKKRKMSTAEETKPQTLRVVSFSRF